MYIVMSCKQNMLQIPIHFQNYRDLGANPIFEGPIGAKYILHISLKND